MHIDILSEQVPDATTLLHFRHLMESNKLKKYDKVQVLETIIDDTEAVLRYKTLVENRHAP